MIRDQLLPRIVQQQRIASSIVRGGYGSLGPIPSLYVTLFKQSWYNNNLCAIHRMILASE
jgi:hypothetical protein